MPQYVILNLSFFLLIQVTNCHPNTFFKNLPVASADLHSSQVEVPRPIVVEKCIEVPKIQVGFLSVEVGWCVDLDVSLESLFLSNFCWFVLEMGSVESGLWWKVEERTVRVPKIVNTVGPPRVGQKTCIVGPLPRLGDSEFFFRYFSFVSLFAGCFELDLLAHSWGGGLGGILHLAFAQVVIASWLIPSIDSHRCSKWKWCHSKLDALLRLEKNALPFLI